MGKLIFLALVQSVYSYGISIWGGAANNVLSKLIVTINCIIKFLLNLPVTTNTSSIYKEINYVLTLNNKNHAPSTSFAYRGSLLANHSYNLIANMGSSGNISLTASIFLDQGFPKGGPRNPGVPWKDLKGSAYRPKIKQNFHEKESQPRRRCSHIRYFIIMDSWLKTGRLASGKNVLACSPAENNENISEIDVSSLS
ncbi:zinc finger BED domain-containing protein 5-like, partial [Aphis craccivora]